MPPVPAAHRTLSVRTQGTCKEAGRADVPFLLSSLCICTCHLISTPVRPHTSAWYLPCAAARSFYIFLFQAPIIPELSFVSHDMHLLKEVFRPGTPYGPVSSEAMSSSDIEYYKHAFGRPGKDACTFSSLSLCTWEHLGH